MWKPYFDSLKGCKNQLPASSLAKQELWNYKVKCNIKYKE